jgi:hypothetical protein
MKSKCLTLGLIIIFLSRWGYVSVALSQGYMLKSKILDIPSEEDIKEFSHPILTLACGGGYVSLNHAFIQELPEVILYNDGRFIKRDYNYKERYYFWKEGRLSSEELNKFLDKITSLGFFEWDEEEINKAIWRLPLITDLPTVTIKIKLPHKEKSFSCYGLEQYLEFYPKELEKKLKPILMTVDHIRNLKASKYFIPQEIILLVGGGKKDSCFEEVVDWRNTQPKEWPIEAVDLEKKDSTIEDLGENYWRIHIKDRNVIPQIIKTLQQKDQIFQYKGNRYFVTYRPSLPEAEKW